jgi:hypothetical protein
MWDSRGCRPFAGRLHLAHNIKSLGEARPPRTGRAGEGVRHEGSDGHRHEELLRKCPFRLLGLERTLAKYPPACDGLENGCGSRGYLVKMKFPTSAVYDGNAQAKCGVSCREAANFVVNKASRLSCGDDLDFADVLLAFGVDDPDRASFLDRLRQRFQARQILSGFSGEENQICVLG